MRRWLLMLLAGTASAALHLALAAALPEGATQSPAMGGPTGGTGAVAASSFAELAGARLGPASADRAEATPPAAARPAAPRPASTPPAPKTARAVDPAASPFQPPAEVSGSQVWAPAAAAPTPEITSVPAEPARPVGTATAGAATQTVAAAKVRAAEEAPSEGHGALQGRIVAMSEAEADLPTRAAAAPPARPAEVRRQRAAAGVAKTASSAIGGETAAGARPEAGEDAAPGGPEVERYKAEVLRILARQPRRPTGLRGRALVGLEIGASGRLAAAEIRRSSGEARLDAVALAHVRRAAPFPPTPTGRSIRMVVAIESVG